MINTDKLTTYAGFLAVLFNAASCHQILPEFTAPLGGIATAIWAYYTNRPFPPSVDRRRSPKDE